MTRWSRFDHATAWLILVLVSIGFAFSGCGPRGGLSDRYVAERLAWQAQKLRRAMRDNPELATDEMRRALADKYGEIVRTFPPPAEGAELDEYERDVAAISGMSRLALAALSAEEGDLDEAVRLYTSVRDSYAFDRGLAVDAMVSLARTYEQGQDWPSAVRVYEDLTATWAAAGPDGSPDPRILASPIRVALGHQLLGDQSEARRAFAAAGAYYDRVASEWEGTPTAQAALAYKAEALEMGGRWAEAVAAYEQLDGLRGNESNRAELWLKLAELYELRLGRRARAEEYYRMVERDFSEDPAGATASIALARYDIERKKYGDTRARLERVVQSFGDNEPLAATAAHYIALSYELEGRWESAAPAYAAVAHDYPTTLYGLTALLHVSDRYLEMGETDVWESTLERAAEHYERVSRDYAGTPAEIAARTYLADVRARQGRWEEAAEILLDAAERHPESQASPGMLLRAADMCEKEMGDRTKAREILERLVTEYPESAPAKEAEKRLGALQG